MLFFRRLFNFDKAKVTQLDQRMNHRYTPGAGFPLQATLVLGGKNWPAKVLNISGNGLGLLLDREAATTVVGGMAAKVRLVLAEHQLELDAHIAHARPKDRGLYVGLGLNSGDFLVQKAYLQLLQPIAIGQSLQPVPPDRVIQNEPQFIKQIYRGEGDTVLTVWLAMTMGTPLHSFEFQMDDYFCRAIMETGVLEAYTRESLESYKGKLSTPVFDTTGGLDQEIRQLFRWIVPNLSQAVPDDVRASLQGFAGRAR